MSSRDTIYSKEIKEVKDFVFDTNTANVFDDMLNRSIPLYQEVLEASVNLCSRFAIENTNIHDLGCSTGQFLIKIANRVPQNINIIGVDSSEAMIDRCYENLKEEKLSQRVNLIKENITKLELKNTSVVVMNYTLQFLPKNTRLGFIKKIYNSLELGGALIITEKVTHSQASLSRAMIDLHERFKEKNGYSKLEIAQKRNALEKVLIPFSTEENYSLLSQAGFSSVEVFLKWYNFASFLAVK